VTVLEADVVKAVRAPVPGAFIKEVLAHAGEVPEVAARVPSAGARVAVRLTSDRELERLNRTYAGEDHATDVLSFAGSGDHLGDIAISWPAVVRQAAQFGHDPTAELALLAVHGLLHLLGWDHATTAQRREMTRLTLAALERSGLRLAPRRL
jgi:probable rRNA maturation factor